MQMSRLFLFLISAFTFAAAEAQDFTSVLRTIEQGNTRLAAARQINAAKVASRQAENVIGATSLEYSPFFHGGYRGIVSSELIVTQEFDYPTLYRERRKSTELQKEVMDLEYMTLRRDILLEAAKKCYDLSTAYRRQALIRQRLAATDSLLTLYTKRLDHGHATIIDYNRIRMDRMALVTESAESQGEALAIIEELQRLNGGEPIVALDTIISSLSEERATPIECIGMNLNAPSHNELQFAASHHELQVARAFVDDLETETLETATAEAELAASRHELQLSRKSWYPTFTAGFRVNTEMRDANGGFVVGVAFPLFGNGKKQRAAEMRTSAAEMELADARAEALSRVRALKTEATNLQRILSTYDVELMKENLTLLLRAVLAGEISIMDYYPEAERIYGVLQQRLEMENAYNKVYAELHRDEL